MPNKLTDAEIIKALEEYINFADLEYTNHTSIEVDILKYALDLINRQEALIEKLEKVEHFADKTIATLQAENSNLSSDLSSLQNDLISAKAEVERLNNNISAMAITLSTSARATRHEAYKEFANELKCRTHEISYNTMQVVNEYDIDNLLNELVGDLNGKDV